LLPAGRRQQPDVQALLAGTDDPAISLVHLIHRNKGCETQNKDYEFSTRSMREHWRAGLQDMRHSLQSMARAAEPTPRGAFRVFDLTAEPSRQATA
jgi:NTE family protein